MRAAVKKSITEKFVGLPIYTVNSNNNQFIGNHRSSTDAELSERRRLYPHRNVAFQNINPSVKMNERKSTQ